MERRLIAVVRGVGLGFVVLLFGLLVWKVAHRPPGASFVEQVHNGATPTAPQLDLPALTVGEIDMPPQLRAALSAGNVTVADLGDRPLIVNFFASWCRPCRDEMPALAKVARQLSGEISFVGVATQDFKQDARTLVSLSGTTYPTLYDGPGHMWGTWGITGLPETFVIDTEGRVVDHVAGRLDDEGLTRIVASARSSAR